MNLSAIGIFPAALLIASAPALYGQGTIVYHNPPDIPIFAENFPYELDVDQNGTVDYRVVKSSDAFTGSGFTAHGMGANASLTTPEQPPSLGVYILPLAHGAHIGPSLMPTQIWFETYLYEPIPGLIFTIPAYFHGCTTSGCGADPFYSITAYWGIQFQIDGNLHYGWVQVETPQRPPGVFIEGGIIKDWAYNSVPGQPILAGQVPEPGTWALLTAGSIAFLMLKTRRRPK